MSTFKVVMKYLLAAFYLIAGVNHFVHPQFYLRIMPPYLPSPLFLQYVAGFFEVLLGAMVLIPKYTRLAAWGLIILLIAIFPANIHMAIHHELYPDFSSTFLWIRLPLQLIFIAWAWWFTGEEK